MIEPPKEIYIDFSRPEPYWSEESFNCGNTYILKPRWIPVEEGLPPFPTKGSYQNNWCKVVYLANWSKSQKYQDIAWFSHDFNAWLKTDHHEFEASLGKVVAWQPITLDDPYIPPNPAPPS